MEHLPVPPPEAIIYEDDKLYVCLASYPLTIGHTVVVWKDQVEDLHLLSIKEYEYLMDIVDQVRNILLGYLNVEKVYLLYMDEAKQVHWHLVPRYDEEGFNILMHEPRLLEDFSLARELRENLSKW